MKQLSKRCPHCQKAILPHLALCMDDWKKLPKDIRDRLQAAINAKHFPAIRTATDEALEWLNDRKAGVQAA